MLTVELIVNALSLKFTVFLIREVVVTDLSNN